MSKSLEIAKLFESTLKLSYSIDSGVLFSKSSAFVSSSVHEPNQSKSRDFIKFYNAYFPITSSSGSSFSKSRRYRLVLQEGEKKEDIYWELWNSSQILQVKDLKKVHSVLTSNPTFGRLAWSFDDKYVLYTAEALSKKSSHFWSGEENVGNGNLYKENFGENLKYLTDPKLFVYDISLNEVKEVETPAEFYSAQPCFRPGTDEFVFIGYEKYAFKLGISAMVNRRSKLFKKRVGSDLEEIQIKQGFIAAQLPKFSPNGQYLSYLAVPEGTLSHSMCMALVVRDMNSLEDKVIVDIVNECNEEFNGIYGMHDSLSTYNWVNDNTIAFQTPHNAGEGIFIVNLDKDIKPLNVPLNKPNSLSILDIHDGSILLKASNPLTPEKLYIYNHESSELTQLDDSSNKILQQPQQNIKDLISSYKTTVIKNETSDVKSVLYHNESNANLFVFLHGGPHTSGTVNYIPSNAFRMACGFNLLVVNYRGSVGFGAHLLNDLLGNIGSMDVEDCVETINLSQRIAPASKVITYGGSHGGFLALHLASRMKLDGSITVNGALDVASMLMATDINDWAYAEVLKTDIQIPPSPEQLIKMYQASPISRVAEVQCPVLIIAGGADLRVPPSASMEAYRSLKANNKETQMLWYPEDGHGLLNKATTYDYVVNSMKWALEKINPPLA